MYEYECVLTEVYDGDTITVDIDLGFDVWLRRQRVRLAGIDAPEIRARDAEEKRMAVLARERLSAVLAQRGGRPLRLVVQEYNATEKYGRILGRVFADGVDAAQVLLAERLVKPYDGGKRGA